MKRLISFKKHFHEPIKRGQKTETRRMNRSWLKMKKGDQLWVKGGGMFSGYKDALMVLELIENPRLQRLQKIKHSEAVREGMPPYPNAVASFWMLWDKINEKPGTRWSDNPEVVVLRFRLSKSLVLS